MPNHKLASNHSLANLLAAYHADPPSESAPHDLLYRGDDILALCLRSKFNPEPGEVWLSNDPVAAEWGKRLADLKGKKTLPLYYCERGRTLYTFKGHHAITGDTNDPQELAERKSPVPLSRIVFLKPILERSL